MRERERERGGGGGGEGEGERERESELESQLESKLGERVRGYHSMFTSVTHVPKTYSVCVLVCVCLCVCVCCHASLLISLDPHQARIEQK